jgi:hypothetical protein
VFFSLTQAIPGAAIPSAIFFLVQRFSASSITISFH